MAFHLAHAHCTATLKPLVICCAGELAGRYLLQGCLSVCRGIPTEVQKQCLAHLHAPFPAATPPQAACNDMTRHKSGHLSETYSGLRPGQISLPCGSHGHSHLLEWATEPAFRCLLSLLSPRFAGQSQQSDVGGCGR